MCIRDSLSFVRVYSGVLNTGTSVLNSTKKQKERIGRILQMHANHREDCLLYTSRCV